MPEWMHKAALERMEEVGITKLSDYLQILANNDIKLRPPVLGRLASLPPKAPAPANPAATGNRYSPSASEIAAARTNESHRKHGPKARSTKPGMRATVAKRQG